MGGITIHEPPFNNRHDQDVSVDRNKAASNEILAQRNCDEGGGAVIPMPELTNEETDRSLIQTKPPPEIRILENNRLAQVYILHGDPVFFPSLKPETHRGTIILPYVQKISRAFGAQFTTFHIFGAPLPHNCQLLTILYRVDPPHY
jgi:hypothetical protein